MTVIDVHMVNVRGLGAARFVNGVLGSLASGGEVSVNKVFCHRDFVPNDDFLRGKSIFRQYRLGYLSRLFEIFSWRFFEVGKSQLLVMGDLPLNTRNKQYIICQQALMFCKYSVTSANHWKYKLFRLLFRHYLKPDDVVIVQTESMLKKIKENFGGNVKVVLLDNALSPEFWPTFRRVGRSETAPAARVKLFYPAAFYPHKNHTILQSVKLPKNLEIILTVSQSETQIESDQVVHIGRRSTVEVFELYKTVDGLLFLSLEESLGLPLLEAISCNLPVICANADYSEQFRGDNIFRFDPRSPEDISAVLHTVSEKIESGWWPEWGPEPSMQGEPVIPISKIISEC